MLLGDVLAMGGDDEEEEDDDDEEEDDEEEDEDEREDVELTKCWALLYSEEELPWTLKLTALA